MCWFLYARSYRRSTQEEQQCIKQIVYFEAMGTMKL